MRGHQPAGPGPATHPRPRPIAVGAKIVMPEEFPQMLRLDLHTAAGTGSYHLSADGAEALALALAEAAEALRRGRLVVAATVPR